MTFILPCRFNVCVRFPSIVDMHIAEALNQIVARHAIAYFRHCGYEVSQWDLLALQRHHL